MNVTRGGMDERDDAVSVANLSGGGAADSRLLGELPTVKER
jgi:hypothetical protein